MIRVIHAQLATVPGPILVDDIDDGLPNKESYRLGSHGDPKAYLRDGYADKPKQPCYIARVRAKEPVWQPPIAGYIDLLETQRVLLSSNKGKVQKLLVAGMVQVVNFVAADVAAPTVSGGVIGGGPANLTISGTKMASLQPDLTGVIITGTGGPIYLDQATILAGGGTISDTTIFLPAALVPGIASPGTFVQVRSDEKLSAVVAL